jgi:hypothetical protein
MLGIVACVACHQFILTLGASCQSAQDASSDRAASLSVACSFGRRGAFTASLKRAPFITASSNYRSGSLPIILVIQRSGTEGRAGRRQAFIPSDKSSFSLSRGVSWRCNGTSSPADPAGATGRGSPPRRRRSLGTASPNYRVIGRCCAVLRGEKNSPWGTRQVHLQIAFAKATGQCV